jgi:hypothetical protein
MNLEPEVFHKLYRWANVFALLLGLLAVTSYVLFPLTGILDGVRPAQIHTIVNVCTFIPAYVSLGFCVLCRFVPAEPKTLWPKLGQLGGLFAVLTLFFYYQKFPHYFWPL